ncbi:pseudouridine synthase [Pelomonas sp. KK5]|uniref:pseudouridine synthase n=1 Tax=Pelomonas sp. KK5 TaxID=1855730 RepID=UPI0009F96333|nr:pseudouridine synthase [Pelomonas sp. KK5]
MATLKLNKKPAPAAKKAAPGEERRAPLRGKGVSRPRQTLEAAQAERAQKQAEFEQRRAAEAERFERYARPQPQSQEPRRDDRRPGRPAQPGSFQRDEPRRHAEQHRQAYGQRPGDEQRFAEPRRDQRRATAGAPGPRGPARPASYPAPQAYQTQPYAKRPQQQARPHHDDDDDDDDFVVHTRPEGERLSKRMTALGMASRREADEWIGAGWVKVDGKLAVLGHRVVGDVKIEIDPQAFKHQAGKVTILIHKPIGYVSGQAEDGYEPASVLVKSANQWKDDPSGLKFNIGHARGLAPAGRLDIDSTGLLVLTQDGRIAKTLIGEDSKVEKEYLVRVEYDGQGAPMQRVPAESIALLNHGLMLDDVQLKPAKVSWINDDQLRFVLKEGRKRQIRRMCELVGLKVVGLKRVRIGQINLGHLPAGQWRFLSPWERF